MAQSNRPTFTKRQREQALRQKKKEKARRRAQRKEDARRAPDRSTLDEDPDIAGIVPGPQPLPEVWDD